MHKNLTHYKEKRKEKKKRKTRTCSKVEIKKERRKHS